MNQHSIVWDILFVPSAITNSKSSSEILGSIEENLTGLKPTKVMNWNSVLKGQKVSRSGFTSGLRIIYDISDKSKDEILTLTKQLNNFSNPIIANNNLSIAEVLPLPLDIKTKKSFPEIGKLLLSVKFTHGLGYDDVKSINSAVSNQTKDTKDGLDPTREGKGSSGKLFSTSTRSLLSDSYWFRIFPVRGGGINEINVNGRADGGAYQLSFDLRKGVSELVQHSENIWWDPLDPEELTLNPKMVVDMNKNLESKFDPSKFYHLNAKENLIENVFDIEKMQTGDDEIIDDLEYTFRRIRKGRRSIKQLTKEDGLVQGLEKGVIEREVVRPWFSTEFINCLGFFLMTRKPKYWRNGEASIELLHPYSEEIIESLKEE
ncbi:hypothetical protein N8771_02585 [Euryarchaeota archaeon]|nr:hypothetical protein [Euryarchaeota archaeon]